MPAPLNHAPYPGCETGGRPRKYTAEQIDKFADELLIWIKNEGNFWLKDFCLEKEIDPRLMTEWADKSQKFSEAYALAKAYQESRIFKGSMLDTFNSTMSKFALINNHGWADKTETKISGDAINPLACILQEVDGTTKRLVNGNKE